LIFKFTQNLKWNFTKQPDSFRITLLGANDDMFYELIKLSKLKKISNLSVSVKNILDIDDIKEPFPHILYVCQSYNYKIKEIYHKILASNCLLITNNCNTYQFVMINLTNESQKQDFEVNRITIFGQKIDISPKLLILGGHEIDILELYNKLETELDSADLSLNHQRNLLDEQESELDSKKREINERKKDVILLQFQIQKQKESLGKLTSEISVQEKILNQKLELLNNQKSAILKQEREIDIQRKSISNQKEILNVQLKDINNNKETIERQTQSLNKQTKTIKNQKNTIQISILIIVVFAFLIFAVLRVYRNKQKINKQLVEKNNEIQFQKEQIEKQSEILNRTNANLQNSQKEIKQQTVMLRKMNRDLTVQTFSLQEKNKQINAGLRYAQTIQNAILPALTMKRKDFEYFVIYKPREIVSGDFFWFSEISESGKNFILASVIDCTGHGVPGAFMAMIGNRILNETIIEKKIYEPENILETMHAAVKMTLKQGKSDNTDGMDLGIIRAEKKKKHTKLIFSGAKQSFYILREKTGEVLRIRGDIKAIGGLYYDHIRFTSKSFILEKNDIVYLLSDGIIDQNSSEKKKFGTPKFMALIKELHNQPFENQKNYIENYLENFSQGQEQRDDITLMAIKF
jgi:serine phosphatase RsbU (regulator of sigma subunit)